MTYHRIWECYLGSPYVTDQQAIEKIQHRATKMIPELRNDSYQERLSKLSLPSLAITCVQASKGRFNILISVNQPAF